MNQHACPKIIICQCNVSNQFCIHHRERSGMLKDIRADIGANYTSNLRQEFTGMLGHTCIFCWNGGLNGFVISIFLDSAEQTVTMDA